MPDCEFSYKGWNCGRPVHITNYCRLHRQPANDDAERSADLLQLARDAVARKEQLVLHGMHIADAGALNVALPEVEVVGEAVQFHRPFHFGNVVIAQYLQLRKCHFHHAVNFKKCTFAAMADFDGCEFRDGFHARETNFQDILGMENVKAQGVGLYFEDSRLAGLHLRESRVEGVVFRRTVHSGLVLLQNLEVQRSFSWEDCQVDGKVMWGGANVKGAVHLRDTTISGPWLTDGATFDKRFEMARVTVAGRADFQRVSFGPRSVFRDITLTAGARMDFTGSQFHGDAHFENWRDDEPTAGQTRALVIFSHVPAFAESRFVFRGVSRNGEARSPFRIRMFSFLHTDVSRFRFTNVDWRQEPAWRTPRQRVMDSIRARLKVKMADRRVARVVDEDFLPYRPGVELSQEVPWRADPNLVADLYRDLRQSYESRGSYHEAGQFHVREMEMRRIAHMQPLDHRVRHAVERGSLNLYRAFSLYGESYTRPLAWLGGLLLLAWGWHALSDGRTEAFRFLPHHVAFVNGLHILFPFLKGGVLDGALRILALTIAALLVMALRRAFMRHS